jgi:ABC-type bacteriocin/lantibiotic exporter with double-glycine peptidase domain
MKLFPNYTQLDAMDCGATCLRIIAKYYGKSYSNQFLREKSFIAREGVSVLDIGFFFLAPQKKIQPCFSVFVEIKI